ncbi:hypothetical protein O7602_01335 [Micromonospora sp. WMMD1128]|uniref:hypothetical protein n=1 Tax=unclassified Micromonospora TaxID=2617518 RepID=UPI00248ACDA9|nr:MULTISPECIES: hypothetical protein [unclassified Micromonospora]WBB74236.1 hypothetical protein O7602_01335 [Micromonospora sp. WMMD1128]WFE32380.1 hypothetical protein O7613_22780 [Micromonospora sp. WMMD975]
MSAATDRERYVVHLTVAADDLPGARRLARAIGRSLAFLPELVLGETTVSEEGTSDPQHQIFCDRRLGGRRRCVRRVDHPGGCTS